MGKPLHKQRGLFGALLTMLVVALALVFACDLRLSTGPSEGDTSHTNPTSEAPLKLSVSIPKTEFALSEKVSLTYAFENVSATPISVCAMIAGVIHIEEVRVNGTKVAPNETVITDLDLVVLYWQENMRTLEPGNVVSFEHMLYPDPRTESGPVLGDTVLGPGNHELTGRTQFHSYLYPSMGAGTYTIKYSYAYDGPEWDDLPTIWRGTLYPPEVTFDVR